MATYLCQKTRESSIEAIQRTIAQSKFRLKEEKQYYMKYFEKAVFESSERQAISRRFDCNAIAHQKERRIRRG